MRFSMRSCCCGGRFEKCCSRCRSCCCRSGGRRRNARIILQRALLLFRRHIFVAAQPVARVASLPGMIRLLIYRMVWLLIRRLRSWRRRRWCLVLLLRRRVGSRFLRKTGKRNRHGDRQKRSRQKLRDVFSLPHCMFLGTSPSPNCIVQIVLIYGFATTSCCTSRSSSMSKSAYRS